MSMYADTERFPGNGATVKHGEQHPGFKPEHWVEYLRRMVRVAANEPVREQYTTWADAIVVPEHRAAVVVVEDRRW